MSHIIFSVEELDEILGPPKTSEDDDDNNEDFDF